MLGIATTCTAQGGGGGQVRALAVLDGSLHQIRPDSSVTVADSTFFDPANAGKLDTSYGVQDQVTLMINEASTLFLRTPFNVTVKLHINYTNAAGATGDDTVNLTVGYDTLHTYNSRSTFAFKGAHKVVVTVLSDSTNTTTWDPTSVLLIEDQLTTTPIFVFNCTNTISNITVSPSSDPSADELPVSWNVIQGANQYDLEWAWVDSSALADTTGGYRRYGPPPYNPTLIFRNNATRVTTTGTSYNIPIIYDNTGTVFIRVRPVQIVNNYAVDNAAWSSDASPSIMGQYTFRGHERPLNWQSNISYAEEGKRKVVVQYYDGSLRSRQTVTKDNTTNTSIVGETYYDYQGRPAIQVMPAPTLKTVIKYTAGFNVSYNSLAYSQPQYSQSDFDTLAPAASLCSAHADSMVNDSGASLYYSPRNPVANVGMNQFIPDAHDYPFTETEYMPDNTGRIKRQSGVGPYHQLGTGHETKYFYGTPGQGELDALFGTEVGYKAHYFKNMVRDANGQYSVSYVDMHGRTIATALAGLPPAGMGALPSYSRKTITEALADSNSVSIQDQSMISQKSLLVPATDTFYFSYNFTPDIFSDLNCQSTSICYTCRYDLDITITDNCGNQTWGGQPYTISKQNFTLGALRNSCVDSTVSLNFTLILPEGSYMITKKLTVDPDVYSFYRDSIYLPNNTCTTIAAFINQQTAVAQAANSSCTVTCTNCQTTDADDIKSAMLQDMSPPYGQYADTLLAQNADLYSIFYIPPKDSADYIPVYKLPQVVYLDDNGNPDSVYLQQSGLMVEPNSLTPAQFVQNFRSSWANALLPYHPEYCRLQVLQTNNSSLFYDRRMEAIDAYQQAVDSGFINPTNDAAFPVANTGNIDPFTSQQGAALNSQLENYQSVQGNTMSMWSLACSMVKCDSLGSNSCPAHYATISNTFQTPDMCTADKDMAWRYFREMYLGSKQTIFNKALLANPAGCTPANPAYTKEPSSQTLFDSSHLPEFNNVSSALSQNGLQSSVSGPTAAASAKTAALDSMAATYTANCAAYASQWFQELSACAYYSPTVINNTLIPALTGLATQACDANHPFGASSLPPGQTYPFSGIQCSSFLDIINTYNSQHSLALVQPQDTLNCNAEVIVSPLPYGNQPIYSSKPVYSQPSACECSNINTYYTQYTLSTFGDTSFAAFLRRTQQINMADSDLTTLRNMCASSPGGSSCNNVSKPIYLPPAFQCNSGSGCARCQTIDSLYTLYKTAYPSDTPSITSDADTLQAQKNVLFQNFMNNRLGFNLQTWQYLQFRDTCQVHSADTTTSVSCTSPLMLRVGGEVFDDAIENSSGDFHRTADNGYIIVGMQAPPGHGSLIPFMAKFDSKKNVKWSKTYGNYGTAYLSKVRQTLDGGYVAAGATDSLKSIMIIKTDSLGTKLWEKSINVKGNDPASPDIIQTSDGGYFVTGQYLYGTRNAIQAMKMDTGGNVIWAKAISVDSAIDLGETSIAETGDTILILGSQSNNAQTFMGSLIKLNEATGAAFSSIGFEDTGVPVSAGEGLYTKEIYPTLTGYKVSTLRFNSGENKVGALNLGFDGAVQQYNLFDLLPGDVLFNGSCDAIPTSDGGWMAVGGNSAIYGPCWIKIDSNGSKSWARTMNFFGVGYQYILQAEQNPDSSFTVFGAGGTDALFAVSPLGVENCYDSAVNFNVTQPNSMTSFSQSISLDSTLSWTEVDTSITETAVDLQPGQITCGFSGSSTMSCYTNYNGPLLCGKSAPLLPPTAAAAITPCTDSSFFGYANGTALFNGYTDSLTGSFERRYLGTCMNAYKHESFTVTHTQSEYHFTLYYYDQAGNLLKTISPAGVQENTDTTWIKSVEAAKVAGTVVVPSHTLITDYRYNTLNQVATQLSPDGGMSNFWYDRLGRLAVSQNRKQLPGNQYSYTQYDTIGRIIQVGQLTSGAVLTPTISRNDSTLQAWLGSAASTANQITVTSYDSGAYAIQPIIGQRNMRNRVSWTALFDTATDLANGGQNAAAATYYSYDILGNVDTLLQDFGGGVRHSDVANPMNTTRNRFKKISYNFDLVSGKVNQVNYQHGHPDAFYHSYLYDAENRITNVQSSTDSVNWDNDAFYSYYAHGPLSRAVLGQQQVQGINYAYTLQGWLKAINPAPYTGSGFTLQPDSSGTVVANTAYNLMLDYFNGDYNPISTAAGPDSAVNTTLGSDYRPLYNGNISSMGARIRGLSSPLLYNYQYDQLNRLIHMDAWNRTSTPWSAITKIPDFQEGIKYDPNGNILGYRRNGSSSTSLAMDSLNYTYISGTNKLDHITDSVLSICSGCGDITTQASGNYQYDSIGELIADAQSNISNITWTVYGKIASITKGGDSTIKFTYDAGGHRISKQVIHAGDTLGTWYVRDAQGNILSIYTYGDPSTNAKDLTQTELDVYGSSRLGMWKRSVDVEVKPPAPVVSMPLLGSADTLIFTRGNKLFELTNHLGNVLSTISDKRFGVSTDDSTVGYFNPDIVSANDYYPFGMLEPGRQFAQSNLGGYRYGFNGKEQDNEVKGAGNQIDYGERMYDPRMGRFMRMDPLSQQYPELTPYQFDGNSPVTFIDQDGLEMMYKLPDGRIYIPPPSDHLRIPIPIGATAIPPQTGTHKGNILENTLVNFLTPLAEGINDIVGGASARRRKVVTTSNGKVKSHITTTTTRGASVGRALGGIVTVLEYSPAGEEGGGGSSW